MKGTFLINLNMINLYISIQLNRKSKKENYFKNIYFEILFFGTKWAVA